MSEPFCRLYDTEHGQLLVKLDSDSEGIPEVRYYIQTDNLGVCTIAAKFTDDDAGWNNAEAAFSKSSLEFSLQFIRPLIDMIPTMQDDEVQP